ncbi:MAG: hypothetical protein JEZ07_10430 [Phycisphaerae bacterium]|nr:hypothetical protein [Phycisphaerae bacterium]
MLKKILVVLSFLVIAGCGGLSGNFSKELRPELIVCGADEVYIFDMSDYDGSAPEKIWSWKADGQKGLSGQMQKLFGTTDDCKPVDGGDKILITSSGGALALVDRSSGRTLFSAYVPNAHSAEMLPGGRIAAASSVSSKGNKIMLFDPALSSEAIYEDELYSAHGIVWDQKREVLWAIGYDQLREYKLVDWQTAKPKLKQVAAHALPDEGGHELQAVPDSADLVLSTHGHVYLFDRDKKNFALHKYLGDKANIKAVTILPETRQIAYVQADTSWWSEKIHFLNPETEPIYIKGACIYKIRWQSQNR